VRRDFVLSCDLGSIMTLPKSGDLGPIARNGDQLAVGLRHVEPLFGGDIGAGGAAGIVHPGRQSIHSERPKLVRRVAGDEIVVESDLGVVFTGR
jgi:hypothetical protein